MLNFFEISYTFPLHSIEYKLILLASCNISLKSASTLQYKFENFEAGLLAGSEFKSGNWSELEAK